MLSNGMKKGNLQLYYIFGEILSPLTQWNFEHLKDKNKINECFIEVKNILPKIEAQEMLIKEMKEALSWFITYYKINDMLTDFGKKIFREEVKPYIKKIIQKAKEFIK